MYFKVIGIPYYFICTMKLAPNSHIFLYAFPKSPRELPVRFEKSGI
jgi:hypothetical protein